MYKSKGPDILGISLYDIKVWKFYTLKCEIIVFLSKHYNRRKVAPYFPINNLTNWLYNLIRPGSLLDTILYNSHTIEII